MTPDVIPAEISFAYRASFIPHRKRNLRSELLLGHDLVGLRQPRKEDVRVAFRVCYPGQRMDYERGFELLTFDGQIWWPLKIPGIGSPGHGVTQEQVLAELATGERDLLGTFGSTMWNPTGERPTRTAEDIQTRNFIYDNRDSVAGAAKAKAVGHILIHEGRAWQKGGEPVYVKMSSDQSHRCVGIANSGADRSPWPERDWPTEIPGDFESVQEQMRMGEILGANRYTEAHALAREAGLWTPKIEVLLPDVLRADPTRLRLDALFRQALEFARSLNFDRRPTPDLKTWFELLEVKREVVDAAQIGDEDVAMDRARVRELNLMRGFLESHKLPDIHFFYGMLIWELRRFWTSEQAWIRKRARPRRLARVDSQALSDLGNW